MKRNPYKPVALTAMIILAALLLCGCSRETIPKTVTQTHTTLRTDSLTRLISRMIHESNTSREKETLYVFQNREVTLNENGDTVKEKTERVTDRSRELEAKVERQEREIDSLRKAKNRVDTIDRPVPYPVEVPFYVEKKPPWWQTALMWTGGAALAAVALILILKYKDR